MNGAPPSIPNEFDNLPPDLIGQYAGFSTRLVAFILDTAVLSSTIIFTNWFLHASISMMQFGIFRRSLISTLPWTEIVFDFFTSPFFTGLASFIFVIFYYLFLWTTAGQTIGKAVMGIKIVPHSGGKMTIGRSLLRYAGYYVSGIALGLGFLWILLDDRRLGWHDRIAGTCVVYSWNARPDEFFLVEASEQLEARRSNMKKLFDWRRNRSSDA